MGSLYVAELASPSPHAFDRDHPTTILRRMAGVVGCSVATPALFVLARLVMPVDDPHGVGRHLGVHTIELLRAATLPLGLTASLFAGPIVRGCLDLTRSEVCERLRSIVRITTFGALCVSSYATKTNDLRSLRNYVVAPLCEEIVFRGCVLPLLISSGCSMGQSVAICGAIFGAAHVHHVLAHIRGTNPSMKHAVLVVGFQTLYTSVFGAYASFLFLRTGHLVAPILSHCFCNWMGFPDFGRLVDQRERYWWLTSGALLTGITAFSVLLMRATEPAMYRSLYWNY